MSLTEAIFARPSYSQMERLIAAEEVKNRIMSTYVGTPLVASTAAGMTDTDRIYVYVGSETGYTSGNWYYYDGSAWTSGGVYNSTAFETDDTLTIPDAAADSKAVGDEISDLKNALTTKAEQDGAYPDLTAGQLLSKNESSDSVPYNFRAVGHEATLEYTDAIVGGSVGWNQLCNGTSVTVTSGHKYLLKKSDVWSIGSSTGTAITDLTSGSDMVCDLTQMFGSTIADYVNTLEAATEGSGVTWLRKHFPKMFEYQPYNAGEIVSVQGLSEHVTVGFNQWDEEWEVGNINATTGQNEAGSVIRSKNYIPVLPNTVYYANVGTGTVSNFVWFEYDADKNYLGQQKVVNDGHGVFTTSANAHYIRFRLTSGYGTTYNHDICINLSDTTRNGEYEPYVKRTYPLDDSLTLRGILKLDASNNLYADGDRYLPDGTVQRRYGVVDLGTLWWTMYSVQNGNAFTAEVRGSKPIGNARITNTINSRYPEDVSRNNAYYIADKTCKFGGEYFGNMQITVVDTSYTDAASFKSAMSGVYLVYELATPTTEEADPYAVPQIIDPDGTEEYVSTSIVPVGHESRYPLDIAGRLDKILTMPTANGTYTLRATVNNGAVTYAWVST